MTLWQVLSAPFRRGPRRPLSARMPARGRARTVPLGMEATDLSLIDKVNRRNDALERVVSVRGPMAGFTARTSTDVEPMPDDETYAARYHRAFQKREP